MSIIAGFGGQRGEHTWAGRMKKLQELHFISIKPGKSGPMSHVVIWNPHTIIRYHHDVAKTPGLTEASFTGLLERAMEIGAGDMLKPMVGMSASAAGPIPTLAAQARAEREAAAQQVASLQAAVKAATAALPLPTAVTPVPPPPTAHSFPPSVPGQAPVPAPHTPPAEPPSSVVEVAVEPDASQPS